VHHNGPCRAGTPCAVHASGTDDRTCFGGKRHQREQTQKSEHCTCGPWLFASQAPFGYLPQLESSRNLKAVKGLRDLFSSRIYHKSIRGLRSKYLIQA
jgi:hypothetical protein